MSAYRGQTRANSALQPAPAHSTQLVLTLTQFGWQMPLEEARARVNPNALIHKTQTRAGRKTFTKQMKLSRVIGSHFYLPRFFPIERAVRPPFGLRVSLPKPRPINVPGGIKLTSDQTTVYDYLLDTVYSEDKIKRGTAGCILVMETGLGKTYLAGALIAHLSVRTLVVVPNTNIRRGWEKMLANLSLNVYVHGESKDPGSADVVLMIINSAVKDEIDDQHYSSFYKDFGFVILDEVHNYTTAHNACVFWRTGFRAALYLTATPERLDGMHAVLPYFGGEIIRASEIEGFSPAEVEWDGILKTIEYYGPPEYTKYIPGALGVDAGATVRMLESDPYRTRLIVSLIPKDSHVLIFVENRAFAETLASLINEQDGALPSQCFHRFDCPGQAVVLIGGADDETAAAARSARIVITTYAFGTEGLSLSQMDTLVIATPRRHRMHQLCGRILRRDGDLSKMRKIIDIIDMNVRLRNQGSARRSVFKRRGFREAKTETYRWEDLIKNTKSREPQI